MDQNKICLQNRKGQSKAPFFRSCAKIIKIMLIGTAAAAIMQYSGPVLGAEVIKPGEQADIHFTCRLPNGEIAASTYEEDVAVNSSLPKSPIFIPRKMNTPIPITAEKNAPVPEKP